MQWIKAYVEVDADDPRLTIDLVADLFFDLNVKGVELNDPELMPSVGGGKEAAHSRKQFGVTGYFPDTPGTVEQCSLLEAHLQALRHRHGGRYRVSYQRMDETDWAEAWKSFFWPQRISSRIVIKPTWREFEADSKDIVLEIDPGMAFGTGTHPTTILCLTLIEKYLHPHDRFLDIGTGSGILMLAAARLGANPIHGVDNDEVAVAVARKNLALNGIDTDTASVNLGNLAEKIAARYHMVTANILADVIIRLSGDLQRVISSGGLFICSGIINRKKEVVLTKLKKVGFDPLEVIEQDGWIAAVSRNMCAD